MFIVVCEDMCVDTIRERTVQLLETKCDTSFHFLILNCSSLSSTFWLFTLGLENTSPPTFKPVNTHHLINGTQMKTRDVAVALKQTCE